MYATGFPQFGLLKMGVVGGTVGTYVGLAGIAAYDGVLIDEDD